MSAIQLSPLYSTSKPIIQSKRKADEVGQELLGPLSLSINEVLSDFCGELRSADPSLAAMGVMTCFRMAKGAGSVSKGWKEAAACDKIGDIWGRTQAFLKCAKGVMHILGGAVFTVSRSLAIAAVATASKTLEVAAAILGRAMGGVFSCASWLTILISARSVHKLRAFRNELAKIPDDAKRLAHLQNALTLTDEERSKIRNESRTSGDVSSAEQKLLLEKEVTLKRMTNAECVEAIRKGGNAKSIVERVQAASYEKLKKDAICLTLGVVSMGAGLAITAFGGGAPVIIASIALAVVSLSWIILDSMDVLSAFKESDPGRYDMLLILAMTVACAVAVGVSVFVATTLWPLILAGGFGLLFIGVNTAAYYRLRQKSREETHSLSHLLENVKARNFEVVKNSYDKLSHKDQRRIKRLVRRQIHSNPVDPWALQLTLGERIKDKG